MIKPQYLLNANDVLNSAPNTFHVTQAIRLVLDVSLADVTAILPVLSMNSTGYVALVDPAQIHGGNHQLGASGSINWEARILSKLWGLGFLQCVIVSINTS